MSDLSVHIKQRNHVMSVKETFQARGEMGGRMQERKEQEIVGGKMQGKTK